MTNTGMCVCSMSVRVMCVCDVCVRCVCACMAAVQLICVLCNVLTLELDGHVCVPSWNETLHGVCVYACPNLLCMTE